METRALEWTILFLITLNWQGLALPTNQEESNNLITPVNQSTTCLSASVQILRGKDGRDGRDGRDGITAFGGEKGEKGTSGPAGPIGNPGEDGRDGNDGLKGEKGDIGLTGPTGTPGDTGMTGPTGPPGPAGPPGPSSGGVVYTRWGRTSCPSVTGTQLLYKGRAGRAWYNDGGGGNYQCMPNDPEYSTYKTSVQADSYMYGVEYQYPIASGLHNYNVPCAVCHASTRGALTMIPAKLTCPTNWVREYSGYLMSEARVESIATFECVDSSPQGIPGTSANKDGGVFYHVEANCNGMPCPPYVAAKELTCVVCTH